MVFDYQYLLFCLTVEAFDVALRVEHQYHWSKLGKWGYDTDTIKSFRTTKTKLNSRIVFFNLCLVCNFISVFMSRLLFNYM